MTKSKPRREVLLESSIRRQKKKNKILRNALDRIIKIADEGRRKEYGRSMLYSIERIRMNAENAINEETK
jgi:hypothetical protein